MGRILYRKARPLLRAVLGLLMKETGWWCRVEYDDERGWHLTRPSFGDDTIHFGLTTTGANVIELKGRIRSQRALALTILEKEKYFTYWYAGRYVNYTNPLYGMTKEEAMIRWSMLPDECKNRYGYGQ